MWSGVSAEKSVSDVKEPIPAKVTPQSIPVNSTIYRWSIRQLLTSTASRSIRSSPSSGIGCRPPLIAGSRAGPAGSSVFHTFPSPTSSSSGLLMAQSLAGTNLLLGVGAAAAAKCREVRGTGEATCARPSTASWLSVLLASGGQGARASWGRKNCSSPMCRLCIGKLGSGVCKATKGAVRGGGSIMSLGESIDLWPLHVDSKLRTICTVWRRIYRGMAETWVSTR